MTVGTMAPLMKSELNLNSARIGFLVSAISIGSMLFQVPFGLFADRFGIKWVMVGGLSSSELLPF
jgi:MFS family permease